MSLIGFPKAVYVRLFGNCLVWHGYPWFWLFWLFLLFWIAFAVGVSVINGVFCGWAPLRVSIGPIVFITLASTMPSLVMCLFLTQYLFLSVDGFFCVFLFPYLSCPLAIRAFLSWTWTFTTKSIKVVQQWTCKIYFNGPRRFWKNISTFSFLGISTWKPLAKLFHLWKKGIKVSPIFSWVSMHKLVMETFVSML